MDSDDDGQDVAALEGAAADETPVNPDLEMKFDFMTRDVDHESAAETSHSFNSGNDDDENDDLQRQLEEAFLQASMEIENGTGLPLTPPPGSPTAAEDGDATTAQADEREQESTEVIALQMEQSDGPNTPELPPAPSLCQFVIEVPQIPLERQLEYEDVRSDIIETVKSSARYHGRGVLYQVEFSDGRGEMISHGELVNFENGETALFNYHNPSAMDSFLGKRKRSDAPGDAWQSESSESMADHMDLDDDDEVVSRHRSSRSRSIRAPPPRHAAMRITSRQQSSLLHNDDEEHSDGIRLEEKPNRRSLRTRKPPATFVNGADEETEEGLTLVDDDDRRPLITSDIVDDKTRPKVRRLQRKRPSVRLRKRGSPDSDIEFEAPRRSNRSTRNQHDMRDDALMDEDSLIYVTEEKATSAPKVIAVKEIFQPPDPAADVESCHIDFCHTCGGSNQKGQLVYCQGCSLSFHKNCIGYRSAREHIVTKIGEDDFVLQCKFCIGVYRKKDANAPKYDMCQVCKDPGKACKAFSRKKTTRQEEKLREENGGVDPITPVSENLVNNSDLTLFRCVKCHRGWHTEHLPPTGNDSIATDVRAERLKDYSIDWKCNECSSAKHKIHRLVAWRPAEEKHQQDLPKHGILTGDFDEDSKEYLIKWDGTSYAHCAWKPSAWVFGVVASASRTAFAKWDAERSCLHLNAKDAIPDEYLMPDVILNLKTDSTFVKSKRKEDELAQATKIRKILVKFQGLSYDEVVWDVPPKEAAGKEIYEAYMEAYYDYLDGKFFEHEPLYKIRDRVKEYKASEFQEVDQQPAGLKRGKLMGYQVEGLNWLLENYHQNKSVVLADEMGLGKTVQVISLVASLIQDTPRCWPFLIVVPNATCPNWRREFKQWTPDLRVVTYHGGRTPQELAYRYELFPQGSKDMKAHVVIMSYDSAADPQTKMLFKNVHWQGLVVDEGQRLKNDQNLLYLALRSMKIPFRLLLTGTPLQNNKRELFNLLQFIDDSQNAEKLDLEYEVLDKQTLPKLHEEIRPYFLRRTKAGVLKFLPPMAQIILPVTMTVIQEKLSKSIMAKNPQLIKSMFANGKMNKKDRGSLNNILMQLRKCLCHPFMYSDNIEERHHDATVIQRNLVEASSKLMLLQVMLPELQRKGHRVLIFSQFLQQLDIIEDFLTGMGFGFRRLDGQISSLEKQRRIDAFNAPDSELFAFLLSTRAGGVGINLATADTVIIMDPDFNPHQDIQALSRAHRIGQKKKVLCFQLVTKDSVEERIMQIGRKKMALDHALIESMDDEDLGGDDLESILKHGAQKLFDEDHQIEAIHYDAASVEKLLDRSQIEQTKTDEEESGEGQFSYARVWANEKSGFEDTLGDAEAEAPEPISSSVWDRILAEREEEARRQAEANREVLGRGGRRRTANKSNGTVLPEGHEAESSDSSDVYSGAESADESEDDAGASGKGKRRKTSIAAPPTPQTKTPPATPAKKQSKTAINANNQQTSRTKPQSKPKASNKAATSPRGAKPSTPTPKTKNRGGAASSRASTPSNSPRNAPGGKGKTAKKTHSGRAQNGSPTPASKKTSKRSQASNTSLATPAPTP